MSPPAQALGEVSPRSGPNWQCTDGYKLHSLQLRQEKLVYNIVGTFNNLEYGAEFVVQFVEKKKRWQNEHEKVILHTF